MAISISNNIASLQAERNLNEKSQTVKKASERLSTGKQINKAADNPAGLAVALDLLTNSSTASVAARNISDGVSALTVADGALESASVITTRMSELAAQSANGTLSDSQREGLNAEFQQLRTELDRISSTTSFNGKSLLNDASALSIQAGTDGKSSSQVRVTLPAVQSSSLGLTGNISTQQAATQSLEQVKSARDTISAARAEVGTGMTQLASAFESVRSSEINLREAASRIMDADVARESANLVAGQIGLKASTAVSAQANFTPELALKLLG